LVGPPVGEASVTRETGGAVWVIQSGWYWYRSGVAPNETSEAVSWPHAGPWPLTAAGELVDSGSWQECRGTAASPGARASTPIAHTISHTAAETAGPATTAINTRAPTRESITVSIEHSIWSSQLNAA